MNGINYFETLETSVATALQEDIKSGDLTANLIPKNTQTQVMVLCRETAIICGRPWFDEVFKQIDASIQIEWFCAEGEQVQAKQKLCIIKGSARNILTAERSALNFLQMLSGTATVTSEYVRQLQGTHIQLLDTRKTLPGLRLAQKYAVACGGGTNHRIGLFDAILIKENHIIMAGGIQQAVTSAKQNYPEVMIEVETETLSEVKQALDAKADIIMLDNFSLDMVTEAVHLVNHKVKLEVSGDVNLHNLPQLINTKVDFISIGAITKHIKAVDLSMTFKIY